MYVVGNGVWVCEQKLEYKYVYITFYKYYVYENEIKAK